MFEKINFKKLFIILAISLLVLIVTIFVVLKVNSDKVVSEQDSTINIFINSIDSDDENSINIYYNNKELILSNDDNMYLFSKAINSSYIRFIETSIKNNSINEIHAQILREFFTKIDSKTVDDQLDYALHLYVESDDYYSNIVNLFPYLDAISNNSIDYSYSRFALEKVYLGRQAYKSGLEEFDNEQYNEAIDYFNKVPTEDTINYDDAQEKIAISIEKIKENIISSTKTLESEGFYSLAIDLLNKNKSLFENDKDIQDLIKYYANLEPTIVEYTGPIYHVFYHSLIVYPELAFDGDNEDKGYYDYMTTVTEFKRMLNSFYENNYVLININDMIDYEINNNIYTIKEKSLFIPQGKKPLIISIDDLSYYNYMEGDGFASKLVIDENNKVSTLVKNPNGEFEVTRDGDVVPILDDFVDEHPDFSFNGAKGIIALTGYEGVLGYETHLTTSSNYETELNSAIEIANMLKENGWLFANHSYTHNNYFKDLTVTMDQITYDTEKWELQVIPVIGDTHIYISPFGYKLAEDDVRYKYIVKEKQYYIFCPVGGAGTIQYFDNSLQMYRINLDGKTLKINKHLVEPFFNADDIIDEQRPDYIW